MRSLYPRIASQPKKVVFPKYNQKWLLNKKDPTVSRVLFVFSGLLVDFQSLDARPGSEELFCGRAVAVLPAVQ